MSDLVEQLRERARTRAAASKPFPVETFIEWKAADAIEAAIRADAGSEHDFAKSIAQVINEQSLDGAACGWRSCTGCHETNEGAETGHYPYSRIFGCYVGSGCRECGGIGVVWHHISAEGLDAMASETNAEAALRAGGEPVAVKPLTWFAPSQHDNSAFAETMLGTWTVWDFGGEDSHVCGPQDRAGKRLGGNIDAAKAAAQADYEASIRSALVFAPSDLERELDEVKAEYRSYQESAEEWDRQRKLAEAERDALAAEKARLDTDAARYRWLRGQHWYAADMAVVCHPKEAVKLGSYCPSGQLLDDAIDAAVASIALDKAEAGMKAPKRGGSHLIDKPAREG